MNIKDIVKIELIGLNVEIIDSKNKSLIGIKGKIVDETKNMIFIETQDKEIKKIIKNQVKFLLQYQNKKYEINGEILTSRPEERIKK
jgi:ribonuclease P protein subunit POP4